MNETTLPPHNWLVYGHDWAVNHLRKGIVHGRNRHAYLITGVDGIGKRTLAYSFAMALNAPHPTEAGNIDFEARAAKLSMSGNHPDIVLAERDEKTGALKIEAVRDVTAKLARKPYEARYRVAILGDFENARPQAQDALLKTLEEPAETSLLIVLASTTDVLLPTITSRCQIISLRPPSIATIRTVLERHHHVPAPDADLIARVSGGRIGWAINAAQPGSEVLAQRSEALSLLEDALRTNRAGRFGYADAIGKDKLAALPLLELWMTYWRDVVMVANRADLPLTNIDHAEHITAIGERIAPEAATTALVATRQTLSTLQYTNTNPRLALEVMFLDYPGLSST